MALSALKSKLECGGRVPRSGVTDFSASAVLGINLLDSVCTSISIIDGDKTTITTYHVSTSTLHADQTIVCNLITSTCTNPHRDESESRAPGYRASIYNSTSITMSQYVGKVNHHRNPEHLHMILTMTSDPFGLLARMAPSRLLHFTTLPRSHGLENRHHPHGQAQTHLQPLDRLRRLRRRHWLPRPAHHRQEEIQQEILQPHHATR